MKFNEGDRVKVVNLIGEDSKQDFLRKRLDCEGIIDGIVRKHKTPFVVKFKDGERVEFKEEELELVKNEKVVKTNIKFDIGDIVRVVNNAGSDEKNKFVGNMYKIADYSPDRKYCYKLNGLIEEFCFAEEELEEVNIESGDRFRLKQVYGDSPEDEELTDYIGEEGVIKQCSPSFEYPLEIQFDIDDSITEVYLNEIELVNKNKNKNVNKNIFEIKIGDEVKITGGSLKGDIGIVKYIEEDNCVIKSEAGLFIYDKDDIESNELQFPIAFESNIKHVKDFENYIYDINKAIEDLKLEDQGAKIVDDILVIKLGDKHFVTDYFWESK